MDIASFIVQIIIAAFLIWYAIETYKLRKEAAYQRVIAIQPLIDFIYHPEDSPEIMTLENVGSGAALNLQLYIWSSASSTMQALPEKLRPSIIKHSYEIKINTLELVDTSAVIRIHPEFDKVFDTMTEESGLIDIAAIYEDAAGNAYYTMQCGTEQPVRFGRL